MVIVPLTVAPFSGSIIAIPGGLFSAITEKRLELLRYVAERQETLNIRQLAQALGRDYKNVHTDVGQLEELGLIEKSEAGLLTVPYDEIVIHAGLTQAA